MKKAQPRLCGWSGSVSAAVLLQPNPSHVQGDCTGGRQLRDMGSVLAHLEKQ